MLPTKTLPQGYGLSAQIDLGKNKAAAIGLNVIAALMLFPFGYFFLRVAFLLRPDFVGKPFFFSVNGIFDVLLFILILLALSAVLVIAHEGVHGLFFWRLTRERPKFAFKGAYAFAAAPQWFLPRNPYVWVGLSPLVVLSLLGCAAFLIIPAGALPYLLAFITLNAAGAMGDVLVTTMLLVKYPHSLVNDNGDSVSIYLPATVALNSVEPGQPGSQGNSQPGQPD
jgi:hypothetical protein